MRWTLPHCVYPTSRLLGRSFTLARMSRTGGQRPPPVRVCGRERVLKLASEGMTAAEYETRRLSGQHRHPVRPAPGVAVRRRDRLGFRDRHRHPQRQPVRRARPHASARPDRPVLGLVAMIRIAISLEVIARTLPLASVGYEDKTDEEGERLIVMVGVGLGYVVTDAI